MHLRPAGCFAGLAQQFESNVEVKKESLVVDGKSVMDLMLLAASVGSQLEIRATGSDADSAVSALGELVTSGFPEGSSNSATE